MSADAFIRLERALHAYARRHGPAEFWLRDDDAAQVTASLQTLIAMTDRYRVPLALAVSPALARPALPRFLDSQRHVRVLVHGLHHRNLSDADHKKSEFGINRAADDIAQDLTSALIRTQTLFGRKALPVFVPPWNKIARAALPLLTHAGYAGLSTFRPRAQARPAPGLIQVNTHIDLIAWRRGGTPRSPGMIAGLIVRALARRHAAPGLAGEPIGILSHHLQLGLKGLQDLEALLACLAQSRQVKWARPQDLFPGPHEMKHP